MAEKFVKVFSLENFLLYGMLRGLRMLKLNIGKGHQVMIIKLPQSVAILCYSQATVAAERTG